MKTFAAFTAALGLLFPISSSFAQPQGRDITVQGVVLTPARWAAAVSRKLDKVMAYPVYFSNEVPTSGIVTVIFRADDANRPTALTLIRRSGDRKLDRAAMAAINRLGPLPAMPAAFRSGQLFVANLLFAASVDEYDQQVASLRKEAKAAQIVSSADPTMVALVITSYAGAGS